MLSTADLGTPQALALRVESVLAQHRRAAPFAAVHLVKESGDLVRAAWHGVLDGGTVLPARVPGDAGHPMARASRRERPRVMHTVDGELTAEPSPLGPAVPTDLAHLPLDSPDGPFEGELSVGLSLEVALLSNRTIGMAVGVLMSTRRLSPEDAFGLLEDESSTSNRKLRTVAEGVVARGRSPQP